MIVPKRPYLYRRFPIAESADRIGTYWRRAFFYSSGRIALIAALKSLNIPERASIILPSYICSSVPETLRKFGYSPRFVDVTPELLVHESTITEIIKKERVGAVLLVDYFGLSHERNIRLANSIKAFGVKTILDKCHSASSQPHQEKDLKQLDAIVYSFRKTFNVPSSGALRLKGNCNERPPSKADFKQDINFFLASLLEEIVCKLGWPNIYSPLFDSLKKVSFLERSADKYDSEVCEEIELAYSLYELLADQSELKAVEILRKNNFSRLTRIAEALNIKILLNACHTEDLPQALPVVDETQQLASFLVAQGIGAYNWPGADLDRYVAANPSLFPNTAELNKKVVCLPIHQGIKQRHIDKLKLALTKFQATNGQI